MHWRAVIALCYVEPSPPRSGTSSECEGRVSSSSGQPTKGGPLAWGLDGHLTTLQRSRNCHVVKCCTGPCMYVAPLQTVMDLQFPQMAGVLLASWGTVRSEGLGCLVLV
jgi:hypothetical protein